MKIVASNVIKVTQPTAKVVEWVRENLVIPNPDYAKKVRMGLFLGGTPKHIYLYTKEGDTYNLPYGCIDRLKQVVGGDAEIEFDFGERNNRNVPFGEKLHPVSLYPYQEEAVKAMITKQHGILHAPAGSGKTQMGIAIIQRLGKRALWLTHTTDLLSQSRARARLYMPDMLMGTITAGKADIGMGITFATVQTMSRLDLSQVKNLWDVIITDEVHRVAGSPTAVSQFYKVLNALSAPYKFGLTATPHRSDGLIATTYALVGDIAYTVPDSAVRERVVKVRVEPVVTNIAYGKNSLNFDGTLNFTGFINDLCENTERNWKIVAQINANSNKSSLVLSDRVEHLQTMRDMLPKSLKDKSVVISGQMNSKKGREEREKFLQQMRTGEKQILFATYALAKEGLDIPRLERLYLTTPHSDSAVITQSIGRIARACEGKSTPIAYDFVDNTPYSAVSYRKRRAIYRKIGCDLA